jgi:hypothetical protein
MYKEIEYILDFPLRYKTKKIHGDPDLTLIWLDHKDFIEFGDTEVILEDYRVRSRLIVVEDAENYLILKQPYHAYTEDGITTRVPTRLIVAVKGGNDPLDSTFSILRMVNFTEPGKSWHHEIKRLHYLALKYTS